MELSLNSSEIEIIFKDEREDDTFNPEKALENFLNKNLDKFLLPLIPPPIKPKNGKDGNKGDKGDDGKTPIKGIDYFTKKELSEIRKTIKEAILSELPKIITEEEINVKFEDILKKIKNLPTGGGGALFLRQLMDVNVGNPTAQQYGLTYNPSRSEFSLTTIDSNVAWGQITGTLSDQTDLQTALDSKQATLVSGTNIKTINSTSLLGSGDISISASPGGSTTQVQFNDAGAFGGDANFIWDKTNDRLGVQATSPQVPLHVASVTGTTLNNVTTGSASLVSETLPSAPTGSTTLIAEPAAPSSGSVSFIDQGSGNYTGNGDTYDYRIYTCLDVASTYYLSQYYYDVQGIIPNDADTYNISVDWNDVTITGGTAAYYVEKQVNGGGYSAYGIFTVSNFTDSGIGPGGSTTPYPTYYQNIPSSPPTAFTGGSASGQDVGMGAFNEVPTTVLMEVDSVLTINSIDYVSGSPASGSFDDTGMGTYNPEIAWTDNGGATNAIARVSQDGGSTWIYKYTGSSTSPFKFTDQSNDSAAEARWGQTYSAGAIQYDFAPYGIGTAPSGATVYSTVGSTYSATIPADSVKYVIKHTMTGGSAAPWKVVAPQASPAYGIQFSGDYFDIGYTTWGSGTTVTPQSYGFSGTAQNRDYKIYSSGSGIYSITPLTVSTVAGSGSKSVSLSWTLPSGITTVKILRQINGGGYTVSKTVVGTSTTDDSTDPSWAGNTTVTPTSIVGGTARFDKALTTLTDEPHLAIVESGNTGTRYPKLSFGTATSSSATPVYLSHIYATSSNGYMSMVTGRVNIESSLGATPTVILGTTNIFNNGSSSTIHFQVKGQNDSNLINTRSNQDTVGFGQAIGIDQQTTVQIQPARSGDAGLVFISHASQSDSSTIWRTQTSAGSFTSEFTVGGWMRTSSGAVGTPSHSCRSDTDTGLYFPTANELGITTGGTERARFQSLGLAIGLSSSYVGQLHIKGTGSGSIQAVFDQASGQTADMMRFRNSSGTTLSSMASNGYQLALNTGGAYGGHLTIYTQSGQKNIVIKNNGTPTTFLELQNSSGTVIGQINTVGAFLTPDGSAALPSQSFNGDTNTGIYRIGADNFGFSTNGVLRFDIDTTRMLFSDGYNIAFGATTGTKIGTATSQKIGFWNATPIVQPTTSVASATLASPGAGTNIKSDDTFDGYTLQQVVKALRNTGILA